MTTAKLYSRKKKYRSIKKLDLSVKEDFIVNWNESQVFSLSHDTY